MIRVGFIINLSTNNSLGGINYLRNLFLAIKSLPKRKIEPVILTGKKFDLNILNGFPAAEIIQTNLLDSSRIMYLLRFGVRYLFSTDWFLEQLLRKHNISILSHATYLGENAKIPTICWIPDFQHIHYPEFFSKEEVVSRDQRFEKICRLCSSVLLSSYDAQKDLAGFAPSYLSKSNVLHFVDSSTSLNATDLEDLEKRYKFRGAFFCLPNQFWKHKNHRVVIEALKILKSSNRKVLVLATGPTKDYRDPDYFSSFMTYVKKCDVLDCFKVLGLVPYADLVGLIRYSVSLINPSFFEGWSTTVEEAKSLGKRVILSGIPVHKEQAPTGGVFFDPCNPQDLAERMWNLWLSLDPEADQERMRLAFETFPERKNKFAKRYEEIVLDVISRF